MEFLCDSNAILKAISNLIEGHLSENPIEIAVAFWGKESSVILNENKKFSLICNLNMGGTNPNEVKKILKLSGVNMLQHDKLHAKVVISSEGAIISSANLSSAGLAFDGKKASSWREAGIYVSNKNPEYHKIKKWFLNIKQESRKILSEDIIKAQKKWAKRTFEANCEGDDIKVSKSVLPKTKLQTFNTLNKPGNGLPLYLRSAAAVVALKGEGGGAMPYDAFVFLFSGDGGRAFTTHKKRFNINCDTQSVSLEPDSIGYFIGANGSVETATDKKRKKLDNDIVNALANWMINEGRIPEEAKGRITTCDFEV
ncbi:hypothetical protein CMT41_07330 [Colwellia sp. MT41]|uniref:Phospholipase D-like domain-containing protein n=1 Tax=Colwellia marinimaniae TaxID=1513592 RepID=A0ABQ0MZX5_9GAMM|nr:MULTISPECIES: phospholipase D family protein [Colwellia]ALO34549.1 hypothetical protein CMT41_07330 [Colwellia sp. MT41]GAW97895.1 hypothetical protein MTCD1_03544 [Colwellia marinimaniae]